MRDNLPPATLPNLARHLKTITRHKIEVGKLMFAVGLPVLGAVHDISKYSPTELATGARFYQGDRSPNAAERQLLGYSSAWLHHQGRNKHHFEYWIDPNVEDSGQIMTPAPMPMRYIVEMFCDRVAACKVYQGKAFTKESALNYYMRGMKRETVCNASNELNDRTDGGVRETKHTTHQTIMHPDTRAVLEGLLRYMAEYGEERTLRAIRSEIVEPRWTYGKGARF